MSPHPSFVKMKDVVEVEVLCVEGPHEVYVREREQKQRLSKMGQDVSQSCKERRGILEEGVVPEWVVLGVQCGTYNAQKETWCRVVVEELAPSCAYVFYVDYGYSETLPFSR